MKAARIALIALACTVPLVASAQWVYLDKDGRKVFSDKAPPPEIATERILKTPKGVVLAPAVTTDAGAAGDLPKAGGTDKGLEDRKKQLAAADAEKKKAEEDKYASAKADNCARARQAKNSYDSGQRLTRVDAKGERNYLSDDERAAEVKRLEQVIARDCAQ
jgi:hypothetical protein